jgi:N-acyl-L-homoserine lactone synthetase
MKFRMPWMSEDLANAVSPRGAIRDLLAYMRRRQRHEIVFLTGAAGLTFLMLFGFTIEMHGPKREYHRDIIYFQQWNANRTDAQIIAQQKIDGPEQTKREEAERKLEAEKRAIFKRLGDQMNSVGLY